ncbi:MAG: hypothetical protein WAZ20_07530 [Methanothrix sp.]|uniref:hypothetical protein n=1 Tax=Methanothrix sp. TaxID=90426 RepID=UPI003BB1646F
MPRSHLCVCRYKQMLFPEAFREVTQTARQPGSLISSPEIGPVKKQLLIRLWLNSI